MLLTKQLVKMIQIYAISIRLKKVAKNIMPSLEFDFQIHWDKPYCLKGIHQKIFNMKAKSNVTGSTAGFIPQQARYSNVVLTDYAKQPKYIADVIKKGAKAVNLVISKKRIAELINSGNLTRHNGIVYSADYPCGEQYFQIKEEGLVLDSDSNVIKVMTSPIESIVNSTSNMPITADYDLFTIIARKPQANNIRPLTVPTKLLSGNFNLDFCKRKREKANMRMQTRAINIILSESLLKT
jgi:hypothetical protein